MPGPVNVMFHATHLPGSFGNTIIDAKRRKFSQFLAFDNNSQASGKVSEPNMTLSK